MLSPSRARGRSRAGAARPVRARAAPCEHGCCPSWTIFRWCRPGRIPGFTRRVEHARTACVGNSSKVVRMFLPWLGGRAGALSSEAIPRSGFRVVGSGLRRSGWGGVRRRALRCDQVRKGGTCRRRSRGIGSALHGVRNRTPRLSVENIATGPVRNEDVCNVRSVRSAFDHGSDEVWAGREEFRPFRREFGETRKRHP